MNGIQLIGLPYHLGQRDVSMGLGPRVLLAQERVPRRLRELGRPVAVDWIEADDPDDERELIVLDQMSRNKLQNQRLALRVRAAVEEGDLPFVLAGNCNSSAGVIAGIGADDHGIVWFDAHADFDTPETSTTGLFDGMALATVTGQCWPRWRRGIPGFSEVPTDRVVLVGLHGSLDCGSERLSGSGLHIVDPSAIGEQGFEPALGGALGDLGRRAERVYLHLDLDVLDPEVGRASRYTDSGGLGYEELLAGIRMVGERFAIDAVTVSAYDPEVDDRMPEIATGVVEAAARAALGSRTDTDVSGSAVAPPSSSPGSG